LLVLLGVRTLALAGVFLFGAFPLPILARLVRLVLLLPRLLLLIRLSLLVLLLLALLILLLAFLVLFLLVLLLFGLGLAPFVFLFLLVAPRFLEGHLVVRALGDIRVREVASVVHLGPGFEDVPPGDTALWPGRGTGNAGVARFQPVFEHL